MQVLDSIKNTMHVVKLRTYSRQLIPRLLAGAFEVAENNELNWQRPEKFEATLKIVS